MKEIKNEYSLSYSGIRAKRDLSKVTEKIVYLGGYGMCRLMASQDGIKYPLRTFTLDVINESGINQDKPFTLHITVFSPNTSFIDRGDTSYHWNADEGNWHRGCPFFFRENRQPLDLVDTHLDQSVFLLLNGPSMNMIDRDLLKLPGIVTYGVNNGSHQIRPKYWSCVDSPHRFMTSIWADQTITKIVPLSHFSKPTLDHDTNTISGARVSDFPNVVGVRRNERFNADTWLRESTLNWGNHESLGGGRSVMLMSLKACYLLGFRKVYLVGCDFKMDTNTKYFFNEQRTEQAIKNNLNSYSIMRSYFEQLKPHFDEAGFKVYNTSPGSSLEIFPHVSFEDAIQRASSKMEPLLKVDTLGMYSDRKRIS